MLSNAGIRPGTFRDTLLTSDINPAAGVGGPLIRDRLFFYGSARYFRQTKWDRVNKVGGALPDEVRNGPRAVRQVHGEPHDDAAAHRELSVSSESPRKLRAHFGLCAKRRHQQRQRQPHRNGRSGPRFMSGQRSVNVRYLFMKEKNEDVPATTLGLLPPFNPRNLPAMGQYTDPNSGESHHRRRSIQQHHRTTAATKCAECSVSSSTSAAPAMR